MDTFDHALNWTLKVGSHPFPGPDGGTCINEAALVAAGFPYKPIHFVTQMPSCFSRPICRLAMLLNDTANDEERQLLLPYVTRLACADTRKIEKEREEYIKRHIGTSFVGTYLSGYMTVSFSRGLQVLDGALAIGRQADPFGSEVVHARLETARTGWVNRKNATPPAPPPSSSAPSKSLVAKVKGWLTSKEPEPIT